MAEGVVSGLAAPGSVSGLCTLFDLQEGVFNFLRDTDRVFITEAMVTEWLNEGYLDLNARLRLKQTLVEDNTDSDGILTIPTDFVEMITLWFDDVPAQVVDDSIFESYSQPASTALESGLQLVRFFEGQFETYPPIALADYQLRYVARPTVMSDPGDQPTAITPELCVRLRKYALSQAYEREGEGNLAAAAMGEYLEGLPGRPRQMHRMRPAPINLIPAPGPFG